MSEDTIELVTSASFEWREEFNSLAKLVDRTDRQYTRLSAWADFYKRGGPAYEKFFERYAKASRQCEQLLDSTVVVGEHGGKQVLNWCAWDDAFRYANQVDPTGICDFSTKSLDHSVDECVRLLRRQRNLHGKYACIGLLDTNKGDKRTVYIFKKELDAFLVELDHEGFKSEHNYLIGQ